VRLEHLLSGEVNFGVLFCGNLFFRLSLYLFYIRYCVIKSDIVNLILLITEVL
jgi:hypothetical protein